MSEQWKAIKDYPKYEISNLGNARNKATQQILSQRISGNGYLRFNVRSGSRTYENPKTIMTHKAVAEAFIPKIPFKPYVNHKDGNKQNNHVNNLEWCTAKENTAHSIKMGLQKFPCGKDHKQSKVILQFTLSGELINTFYGTREAERITGIAYRDIHNNCKGKQKTCKGFIFKYEGVI